MATTNGFDPKAFLASVGEGRSILQRKVGQTIFSQGDPADAVFYIQKGKVKVASFPSRARKRSSRCSEPGISSARAVWPASRCAWRRSPR